jgi:hypothetical protein
MRFGTPAVRETGMAILRTAVIGAGYFGKFHAQKYARLPGSELVAVVDADLDKARAVAKPLKAEALIDAADLLGRVDAVSVVVPTPAHHAVVRWCLENGLHVLGEKPITRTVLAGEVGEGQANYAGLFKELAAANWQGVMAIETDNATFAKDPTEFVLAAREFVKKSHTAAGSPR